MSRIDKALQAWEKAAGAVAARPEPEAHDAKGTPGFGLNGYGREDGRVVSPPPATIEGFGRFINWAIRQREAGQYVCFAIVPQGADTAIGIFQVRSLEPAFGTAEWGFAIASEFWGSGIFLDGAKLVVDFAFSTLGVHRLEARAAVRNGRGNGALRKLGAVQEGLLRRSFLKNGEYLDQALWTILQDEWLQAKTVWGSAIVH